MLLEIVVSGLTDDGVVEQAWFVLYGPCVVQHQDGHRIWRSGADQRPGY